MKGDRNIWTFQKELQELMLHVIFPISGGGLIYAFSRGPIIATSWLPGFLLSSLEDGHTRNQQAPWLTGFLPDFLWAYAFASYLLWVRPGKPWLGLLLPTTVGLIHEFGQALCVFPGTFDWIDVFTYTITIPVLILFHHPKIR
jgi:hypothetical protein